MKLSSEQIISAIDKLNIKRSDRVRKNGWLGILCPSPAHPDRHLGNCNINVNNGAINCFACGYRSNIITLVKETLGVSYEKAVVWIAGYNDTPFSNLKDTFGEVKDTPIKKEVRPEMKGSRSTHFFTEIDLNPEKYFYTKQRGITKRFTESFNVTLCLSGQYENYMILNIHDIDRGIYDFEARKIMEYEYLQRLFPDKTDLREMKMLFKTLCEKKGYCLDEKNKLAINKDGKLQHISNSTIKYLLQPKTYYPSQSRVKETIFGIDRLDFTKPVFISEGTGSLSKIWSNISTNVSCVFGSKITDEQLEILKKFPLVYYIPDNDIAGYKTMEYFKDIETIRILDLKGVDDNEEGYVTAIRTALESPLSVYEYCLRCHPKYERFVKESVDKNDSIKQFGGNLL